ncbi:MAG: type 1 periplasmic binding fold superfamily protein [Flavobacteriales bacterium]|nr:type 1 periplasmic binding fold superfamily protein [Flavobacteriales bacterium]
MRTQQRTLVALFALALTAIGCKKDEDDPITPAPPTNEEELITTVKLHFRSVNDVEHKLFSFVDEDGDGGAAPVITAEPLSVDSVYAVEIEVLNESVEPADDITVEIEEEGTAHQFFFRPNGVAATAVYADTDVNGRPIGLLSTWTLGSAGSGTVTVTLRHEPDKNAAGVSSGDITNAGGETDIEVVFPLAVE